MKKRSIIGLLLVVLVTGSLFATDIAANYTNNQINLTNVAYSDFYGEDQEYEQSLIFSYGIQTMAFYSFATEEKYGDILWSLEIPIDDSALIGFNCILEDNWSDCSSFIEIGFTSIPNTLLYLNTGVISSSIGFGGGIGYDFYNPKETGLALGLYVDWLASIDENTNTSLEDGGAISIGLKSKFCVYNY